MGQIYFLIFWIPAVASGLLLLVANQSGVLNRPGVVTVWFALALLAQVLAGLFSPVWALGLVAQVALGIYLAIRTKLG